MVTSTIRVIVGMGTASRGVVVLGCLLVGGCALMAADVGETVYTAAFRTEIEDTSALSADELQQLLHIKIYRADPGVAYTSIGPTHGISCRETTRWVPELSDVNGRTPEEGAMTQLKVKAMKAGGNAILAPTCVHHSKVDWGNNCFASWICTGEAVRVQQ